MKKVLQIYTLYNNAGTEKVIMNLYKNIDKKTITFDFLAEREGELDDYIRSQGSQIYYIPFHNRREYINDLYKFLTEHTEYQIIHTHTALHLEDVLIAAMKAGVKCRIAHSHNSRNDLPFIVQKVRRLQTRKIEAAATHYIACSEEAAKWLFPRHYKQCLLLNNGIDLNSFKYRSEYRVLVRTELGIGDRCKVICHIGRFAKQKNQKFIIDILANMDKSDDICLLLVGDGPDKGNIIEYARQKGVYSNIHFLGNRRDIAQILSASDLFVFPSLHEGLGIVLIEAQASGLHCIASENVPDEADVGDLERIRLKDTDKWIQRIKESLYSEKDRLTHVSYKLQQYDIKKTAKCMENFYESQ